MFTASAEDGCPSGRASQHPVQVPRTASVTLSSRSAASTVVAVGEIAQAGNNRGWDDLEWPAKLIAANVTFGHPRRSTRWKARDPREATRRVLAAAPWTILRNGAFQSVDDFRWSFTCVTQVLLA